MMRRRDFLAGVSASGLLAACGAKAAPPLPPGTLSGANDTLGHRLRKPDFPAPTETRRTTVAIVGGGIAGLSAAWKLARSGCDDFLLLEMEGEAGGNSRAGRNEVSAHPLGAHYLPLPPREARATRALLAELGVLQDDPDAAHPVYDEKYLCHAPQERLYTNGYWQEGLWPTLGVPAAERAQYTRFQDFIAELRQQRDSTGRRAFALPLALSSRDPELLALDRITLRDWLLRAGYTAPGLFWLADYASVRPDFLAQHAALHMAGGDGLVVNGAFYNAWPPRVASGLAKGLPMNPFSQHLWGLESIFEYPCTPEVAWVLPLQNRTDEGKGWTRGNTGQDEASTRFVDGSVHWEYYFMKHDSVSLRLLRELGGNDESFDGLHARHDSELGLRLAAAGARFHHSKRPAIRLVQVRALMGRLSIEEDADRRGLELMGDTHRRVAAGIAWPRQTHPDLEKP